MTQHLIISSINSVSLPPEYAKWLRNWLVSIDKDLEHGNVAASLCFQGGLIELLLYGSLQHDWNGIFEEYLTAASGEPLAYSELYGKRLYGFGAQWHQTPVHAIYTRFWFDCLKGQDGRFDSYADLVESFIQPSGWIYNPKVSVTQIRTRMRSEVFMSMAMGVEILSAAGRLEDVHREGCIATLASTPLTGYLSAEYFRAIAYEQLVSTVQMPIGIFGMIQDCQAGAGFSDFAVKNKVDDYMGTAKRTSRDFALHSPLAALHAAYLKGYTNDTEQEYINQRLKAFANHLTNEPFDISAFRIRDLPFDFGTDISPIELVCAAWIRQYFG